MNENFEATGIVTIAFWVASAITIAAAIVVVTIQDVFKAAVFLAGAFIGVAAIFFLLNAEFVGVVQILVYVGAVSILIAFAVMMISDVSRGSRPSRARIASVTVSALVVAAVAVVAYNTDWTLHSDVTDDNAIAGLSGTYVEVESSTGESVIQAAAEGQAGAQNGVISDSSRAVGIVGTLLVRDYVLPFETIGLVIVAALIGALALMRPKEDEETQEGGG